MPTIIEAKEALVNRIKLRNIDLMLRPLVAEDQPFLERLNAQERAPSYADLGLSEPLLQAMLASHLKAEADEFKAQYPERVEFLVLCQSSEIGRLILNPEANDFGLCLRIVDLVLLNEVRNKGIGSDLVCSVIDSARALRFTRLLAKVFGANEGAIRLLRRVGFRQQGNADAGVNILLMYPLP